MAGAVILTVDDDVAISQAITRDLRSRYGERYRIVRSTSGAAALEALEELARRDQPVALIVSDHRMPEMTGIEVYPAELNQVWTNLIDNAIDAMAGHGTLKITSRRDDSDLIVDIVDTGHGMDARVQERAFEPFFTTKDVGKGTGLGLDISRRIVVERHGGEITFDSQSGTTVAHVRLPISR